MLTPSAASEEIGIGFFLDGKDPNQRFEHGGWNEGFVCRATFFKERGQGAVVMINSNEGAPMIEEILRAVAREYEWPGFFPEAPTGAVPAGSLDAFTGSYAGGSRSFNVTSEGGRLRLAAPGQPALELRPTTESSFRAVALDVEVAFDLVDGAVKSFTLRQGGREIRASRQ
jgi:hypothetical protein